MKKRLSVDDILSGLKKIDSEPGVGLEKFTIILKNQQDKQVFVDDMESQSTNILSSTIPSRACKTLNETNNSRRVLEYNLTKEEADILEKDPRVECVEQYIEKKIIPLGFSDETTLLRPFDYVKNNEPEKIKIQALDQSATISGLPDGSDVDVVVVDGYMSPENPEFANNSDGSGGSRVNQINWYDVINYTNPSYPSYPYFSYITGDPAKDFQNNHGSHVCGTISGNTQGWAKKSNIYNINPYNIYMADSSGLHHSNLYLYAIKIWHQNKPINNSKGNKNPTITNHSYGLSYNAMADIRDILSINYRGSTITPQRNYSGAQLSAVLNGSGGIRQVNIVNQGINYTNEPTISFYGGGQASAVAEMANRSVYKIIITDKGSGYSSLNPPTITFSSPPAGGIRATATTTSRFYLNNNGNPFVYVDEFGQINGMEITEAGSGYINPPTVTFSNPNPGGRVAQASVELKSNFIKKINITNGGTGYIVGDLGNLPDVILSGVNCTKGAVIYKQPIIHNGELRLTDDNGTLLNGVYHTSASIWYALDGINICFEGGDYDAQPIVSFYGGNAFDTQGPNANTIVGTKPHARAVMGTGSDSGKIVSINIVKAGQGYTSPPNIVVTNGGGFTAQQLSSYGLRVYQDYRLKNLDRFILTQIPMRDAAMDSDIQDLINSGVIVVSAAGNEYYKIDSPGGLDYNNCIQIQDQATSGDPSIPIDMRFSHPPVNIYYNRGESPGSCPGVICVGAAEAASAEYKTGWSCTGPRVDVYSPGEHINSSVYSEGLPDPRNNSFCLAKFSGTSMASPQVAGMLACYAQNNRTINQQDARNFIINNAKPTVQNGTGDQNLQGGANKYVYFPGISYY
jgi:hypothetical protein